MYLGYQSGEEDCITISTTQCMSNRSVNHLVYETEVLELVSNYWLSLIVTPIRNEFSCICHLSWISGLESKVLIQIVQ